MDFLPVVFIAGHSLQIAYILPIHPNNLIELVEIEFWIHFSGNTGELIAPFFGKLFHPVISRLTNMIGVSTRRIAPKHIFKAAFPDQCIKNRLRAGASANISEANKKYFLHRQILYAV